MKVFIWGFLGLFFLTNLESCEHRKSMNVNLLSNSSAVQDSLEIKKKLEISKTNLMTNYKISIQEGIKASQLAEKYHSTNLLFESYLAVIRASMFSGLFEVGALYMNKYLDLAEQEKNDKKIGQAYANLGVLHMFLGDINLADSLFSEGLIKLNRYAKEHQEQVSVEDQLNIFLDLGHIYSERKQYAKAEQFYLKGFALAKKHQDYQLVYAQIAQSLGILYLNTNQLALSKNYLDLALELQKKLKNQPMISSCLMSLGEFSEKSKQKNQALMYYQKALYLAEISENVENVTNISERLYHIYVKEQKFKLALQYLNQSIKAKEIMKKEQAKEALFKKSFARSILKNEEDEKRKDRNTKILVGFLILFLFLIFTFYFRKFIKSKREVKLLRKRSQEQLEKSKQENSILQENLEFVNKKMASNALQAIQKEESLNQIVHRIKSSKPSAPDSTNLLKSISKDIEKVNSTKNWEEFEVRFIEIHSDFFHRLMEVHPNLSNNERRLCAFLKLDMSTKEIVNLTGQSLRAVELARIRLRKKLNLTNSDLSIFQYLSDF